MLAFAVVTFALAAVVCVVVLRATAPPAEGSGRHAVATPLWKRSLLAGLPFLVAAAVVVPWVVGTPDPEPAGRDATTTPTPSTPGPSSATPSVAATSSPPSRTPSPTATASTSAPAPVPEPTVQPTADPQPTPKSRGRTTPPTRPTPKKTK